MDFFSQAIYHIVSTIFFVFIYILAFIAVNPLKNNRKHKNSSIFIKVSYLSYLALLLVNGYYLVISGQEMVDLSLKYIHILFIILILFLPTLGILYRRNFSGDRLVINFVFGIYNCLVCVALIILFIYFLAN